jgi:citrate lyase subunit beta/citryl-CoA lyase
MRSLLFVPADSPRKLDKAFASGADALILDLEDSVAAGSKGEARRSALAFLRERRQAAKRPRLYVRINGFSSGLSEGDLDAVMTATPDGVVLPKAGGGADIALLDARLAIREALHGLPEGTTRIIAIATETAAALFGIGTYSRASLRLTGLAWGAEDLSADIGALATRAEGAWTEPFRLARNLCLFGAAAAGVSAVDTVYTDFRDVDGLRLESGAAARDGFSGKLAVHPAQVPVINEAFAPDPRSVERAGRIVAAFAQSGDAGVTSLDGVMLDRPHLRAAERLLDRAGGQARSADPAPK